MFWKIKDTVQEYDLHFSDRYAMINIDQIEAISYVIENPRKIKIHVLSGKEFRADEESLKVFFSKVPEIYGDDYFNRSL
jgi:hypothetical protein